LPYHLGLIQHVLVGVTRPYHAPVSVTASLITILQHVQAAQPCQLDNQHSNGPGPTPMPPTSSHATVSTTGYAHICMYQLRTVHCKVPVLYPTHTTHSSMHASCSANTSPGTHRLAGTATTHAASCPAHTPQCITQPPQELAAVACMASCTGVLNTTQSTSHRALHRARCTAATGSNQFECLVDLGDCRVC
jgi:hypothetical protein